MNKEFFQALEDLVNEKGLDFDMLISTLENALSIAYKRQFNIAGNSRNFNGVFDFTGDRLSLPTEFDEDFDYHWWYQCSDGYWAERTGANGTINKHNVINPEVDSLWWPGYFDYLNQGMLIPYSIAGEFRDIRGSYMYYKINLRGVLSS